jgi:hypothetical protein
MGLKKFTTGELIFNEEETREILVFFFPHLANSIKKITIDNTVKGFAQGLLVEAIDASYALGFIQAIFSSTINPTAGVLNILRKFAFKAGKHWFEHASEKDLRKIKIYYIVRQRLQVNFKTVMLMVINGLSIDGMVSAVPVPKLSQYA